jgi:hypothetical protein
VVGVHGVSSGRGPPGRVRPGGPSLAVRAAPPDRAAALYPVPVPRSGRLRPGHAGAAPP